jgi:hypothetical protein
MKDNTMATIDPEVEAMGKISDAMSKVEDPEARARILSWARGKYLPKDWTSDAPEPNHGPGTSEACVDDLGPRASRWMRQTGLTRDQLEQVFHFRGDDVSVIGTIPGQHASDRVANCYLLEGVRALLATDAPSFTDVAARELCRTARCYDATNHSKRLAKFENRITGDAARGWTVTGPGLNAAAELIKETAIA